MMGGTWEFKYFHIVYSAIIYMESKRRPDYVDSLNTGCSGIDAEHITVLIHLYFEYMGMSADEDVRLMMADEVICPDVILARVPSYMSQQDLHTFAAEESVRGIIPSEVKVVAVSYNSHQWLECSYFRSCLEAAAKVTCVPYFINVLEEFLELFREYTVRI